MDMDPLTKEQRRKNMQAIRSKDTKIEIALRKALWKNGIRYRKNYKNLPGKPDIVLTKYKIAIFCDSEFWHGQNWEEKKTKITMNKQYWIEKIEKNMQHDIVISQSLSDAGWTVMRFWGNQIKEDLDYCVNSIIEEIEKVRNSNGRIF